jgi:DNA-binding NtrC family response regulator
MQHSEKLRILYLDDETICLNIFFETFGSEHDIRLAESLTEARHELQGQTFDIIISDKQMPEIDGLSFLREVALSHPESYRVMLTGSISVGNAFREIGEGVIHLFVAKPWVESNIREMMERASMFINNRFRQLGATSTNKSAYFAA